MVHCITAEDWLGISAVFSIFSLMIGYCNVSPKRHFYAYYVRSVDMTETFCLFFQAIFRGAMKGKLIVTCPLPPERIPKYQLLYRDL
ncbi:hypothetical protein CK203_104967 [Vitis vinifera]|uniref:Uncharacterized protein n=1 Tax=Vitis vinifera TaxID=29760 RepID=A0A438BQC1_VITVI|nr:hypothetical protein CK203_104967 [Vitis vinifera]